MFWLWLHVVFAYLAVVLPITATRRVKRLAASFTGGSPRVLQRMMYPRLIVVQWLLALAVVAGLWKLGVPPAWLGIDRPRLVPLAWTAAVIAVAWAVWERYLHRAVHRPDHRARMLERFASMRFLIPADDSMVGWWIAVSITAGVCEETLYRGFFGFYLHHWMPMEAAALVGTVPFALAHLYQGPRGALRSGSVAILLWAAYIATGSIVPGMVLHAAIDVRSGLAVKAALERAAAESRAVAG